MDFLIFIVCLYALNMMAEKYTLKGKLKEIQIFGKNNPGLGYSCSDMAKEALVKHETKQNR